MVWLYKINLVIISDDLARCLGFEAHFYDVPGFIVEKSMRVPQPRYCSKEHPTIEIWLVVSKQHKIYKKRIGLRSLARLLGGMEIKEITPAKDDATGKQSSFSKAVDGRVLKVPATT